MSGSSVILLEGKVGLNVPPDSVTFPTLPEVANPGAILFFYCELKHLMFLLSVLFRLDYEFQVAYKCVYSLEAFLGTI